MIKHELTLFGFKFLSPQKQNELRTVPAVVTTFVGLFSISTLISKITFVIYLKYG
jgi:hypothetical protein